MGEPAAGDATQPAQLLGLAVERCYVVFARNRLGPSMEVRRHDVIPADVAALSGPVRSIPAAAIDRWLPHAVTTWGTADDLRALLPRVFELLITGRLETPPEVVFAKLRHADAAGWPIEELAAVDDVVSCLWLATLTRYPASIGLPAGRVLTALAELDGELSPHLDRWLLLAASEAPEGDPARHHLHDLVGRVEVLRRSGLEVTALFWSSRRDEAARLEMWLSSPLTRGHLPD